MVDEREKSFAVGLIQTVERFVKQYHARLGDQGARDQNALALAAGKGPKALAGTLD